MPGFKRSRDPQAKAGPWWGWAGRAWQFCPHFRPTSSTTTGLNITQLAWAILGASLADRRGSTEVGLSCSKVPRLLAWFAVHPGWCLGHPRPGWGFWRLENRHCANNCSCLRIFAFGWLRLLALSLIWWLVLPVMSSRPPLTPTLCLLQAPPPSLPAPFTLQPFTLGSAPSFSATKIFIALEDLKKKFRVNQALFIYCLGTLVVPLFCFCNRAFNQALAPSTIAWPCGL